MATDFAFRFNFAPCPHRHVITATTGGMHFTDGDVWDDIHEELMCLDCGESLTEEEIRLGWSGKPLEVTTNTAEEDNDVPF